MNRILICWRNRHFLANYDRWLIERMARGRYATKSDAQIITETNTRMREMGF
jgi:hypothetical protein